MFSIPVIIMISVSLDLMYLKENRTIMKWSNEEGWRDGNSPHPKENNNQESEKKKIRIPISYASWESECFEGNLVWYLTYVGVFFDLIK